MSLTPHHVRKISKEIAKSKDKLSASKILANYSMAPGTKSWNNFVSIVRDSLNKPGEYLGMSPDELTDFLDHLPRQVAQSIDRLSSKLNPEQVNRVLAKEQEIVKETTVTTTANTAPYPIPIGRKMLRRKLKERFELNESIKRKWKISSFIKAKDLLS
jgi:hypothetical protein